MTGGNNIVYLHNHRKLPGAPEDELARLLERLLLEKHHGDLLAASEAYAEEKTKQCLAQLVVLGYFDREEIYESLIAWALMEIGELSSEGEACVHSA